MDRAFCKRMLGRDCRGLGILSNTREYQTGNQAPYRLLSALELKSGCNSGTAVRVPPAEPDRSGCHCGQVDDGGIHRSVARWFPESCSARVEPPIRRD
jgi:hypothetical protein